MILRHECPVCGRLNTENREVFYRDFHMMPDLTPFRCYTVYVCEA